MKDERLDDLYPRQTIAAGLAALTRRWPQAHSTSTEQPVFVLAAGWRSGSTLVQRALFSECLIWGEPFGHAGLIEQLAGPLRAFNDGWPEPHFLYRGQPAEALTEKFVANLYPPPLALLHAYLAWFDALLAKPSKAAGKARWGLKEVRLSADHAAFLRWLYPQARFLFLIRNPYNAFRSFAARRDQGWKWYHRWPSHPVTPQLFGRHWRELTASFLAAGDALGALVVHYEDLHYEDLHGGGWNAIRDYVGFELSQTAINSNPPDGGRPPLEQLATAELEALAAEVEPLAAELGYFSAHKPAAQARDERRSKTERRREGETESADEQSIVPPSPRASPSPCPPEKCAILVPVADRIEPACETALRVLETRGYRVSRVHGYKQIDLARNQMASDGLAAGFQETFWIDADTAFHPDMVERLRQHDLPIVCGIYPKKSKRELAIHAFPGTTDITFGTGGGLIELLYAPTGFLRVRREVYESMQQQLGLPLCEADTGRTLVPYYMPLIRPDGDGWWYLAEDFSFCERARQCGFKIMADTTVRLLHIGAYAYGWEDAGRKVKRFTTYHFRLTDSQ
jgi:hypothetical protein